MAFDRRDARVAIVGNHVQHVWDCTSLTVRFRSPVPAVVLTQVHGQGGTASYVAALLSGSTGQLESTATNTQLIGPKVEVTKVTIGGGIITVEFLDHKAGESMDSRPTHSLSKRFGVAEGKLNVAP